MPVIKPGAIHFFFPPIDFDVFIDDDCLLLRINAGQKREKIVSISKDPEKSAKINPTQTLLEAMHETNNKNSINITDF